MRKYIAICCKNSTAEDDVRALSGPRAPSNTIPMRTHHRVEFRPCTAHPIAIPEARNTIRQPYARDCTRRDAERCSSVVLFTTHASAEKHCDNCCKKIQLESAPLVRALGPKGGVPYHTSYSGVPYHPPLASQLSTLRKCSALQ